MKLYINRSLTGYVPEKLLIFIDDDNNEIDNGALVLFL